jgi:Dolichyl-phosphate-mannose-protein mannosyltransferase
MNNPERPGKDRAVFAIALISAVLAGFFLRWYILRDQILVDDEWHGLFYVIGRSPGWLLTHFSVPGATCIPQNIYNWAVGATFGWSELLLRLPLLVCGILCVVICPWLARDLIGTRQAAWLALFLAISPILIFYSRFSRPYSAVAFLGFVSILCAARWAREGGWRWGALYVVTGILAVYFHLFAIIAVITPALGAVVYYACDRFLKKSETSEVKTSLGHWIIAAATIVVLSGLLLLPALIHSWGGTFSKIVRSASLEAPSLPWAMTLIAGTAQPVPVVLFWVLLIVGAVGLCQRNPWFGGTLVSLYPLHVLALAISRPDSVDVPLVIVRYSIPLVPVSLLLVACGIQYSLEAFARRTGFKPMLQTLVAFACALALVLAGPLPQTYAAPNNFTNHGAFQQRYTAIDWSHSFYSNFGSLEDNMQVAVRAEDVSPFYKKLGDISGDRPIVEYPMMIGDHCNPLYYYQYFHRRHVLVGYETDVNALGSLMGGNVYGNNYIDHVLSLVHDPARLRFHNLVSMEDLPAMRARNVQYIVLHTRYESQLSQIAPPLPGLARLYQEYSQKLGPPIYKDGHIAVFQLP